MALNARILGLSTAILLVSGCVSVPAEDALSGIDTPTGWAAVSAEMATDAKPVTENWLADLHDPVITLLVAEAIEGNTNLAAAEARVRATRERVGITRAAVLPTVNGALSGRTAKTPASSRLNSNNQVVVVPETTTEDFNLGFNLSWELDIWGRLTDQTRAAYLGAEAAKLDLASTELSIAGGTAQAFYALTEARLQRQLSERDVQTGESNLSIIERRYNRGISSSLDVRLARSSLASSRATLVARQRTEQEAARRLEFLLGRYPSAAIASAEALPMLDGFWGDGSVAVGDPLSLLATRPDVIAAERRLKAAGLNAAAARKALLPSLSLSGSAFEQEFEASNISFDLSDAAQSLTANLVQPLFQGGRLRAQARAAKADMEAVVFDYAGTVLTAYQEVENALAAERFLTAQLEAQSLAFEEAKAAEELTQRQYLSGTTNIFNLISAQQRRISAESQYISASRQRLSNRIDLYLALGASFEVPDVTTTANGPGNAQIVSQMTPDQKGDRS
ncbi:efflux transporter outer membrane subunit [Parvularcula marina]|uniref:TolC family protein n=1 Tax=Parvularcula marina TaxID=2292771 RepID=A0A371RGX4_9PROT|nr:efflux transporter outer membrane subunit [Parvularcula marina]RFB04704.1 TolC family protein [Parvularcula marina]